MGIDSLEDVKNPVKQNNLLSQVRLELQLPLCCDTCPQSTNMAITD